MKEPDKIAALIQEYKHRKETHQKQVSFIHEIKFSGNTEPFRSEEQIREEVLKDNKPIKIRNIFNGEITQFDNYEQCVDYMRINYVNFQRMLNGKLNNYNQWQLIK